jgi:hypothetical protein
MEKHPETISEEAAMKRIAQECLACGQVLTQGAALAQIHVQAKSAASKAALWLLLSEAARRVTSLSREAAE